MSRRTLPALIAETPLQPQPPALIVFERDDAGKPRAAWFSVSYAKVAAEGAIQPAILREAGEFMRSHRVRGP